MNKHTFQSVGNDNAKGAPPLQHIGVKFPEAAVRQTWLHYFNNYLRERGIITDEEWRKMRLRIEKG